MSIVPWMLRPKYCRPGAKSAAAILWRASGRRDQEWTRKTRMCRNKSWDSAANRCWPCLFTAFDTPVCIYAVFCSADWRKHKWLLCGRLPAALPPPGHWSHRRSHQAREPVLSQSERSGRRYGFPAHLQGWSDSVKREKTLHSTILEERQCNVNHNMLRWVLSNIRTLDTTCGSRWHHRHKSAVLVETRHQSLSADRFVLPQTVN